MTPVGFEPTQLALVDLESTALDHSGKVSWWLLQVLITPMTSVRSVDAAHSVCGTLGVKGQDRNGPTRA